MARLEKKARVSRRRALKYLIGLGSAAIAAFVSLRLIAPQKEEATLAAGYADMVLMNGKDLTVDPDDRVVDAVAVKDGSIQAVDSYKELKQLSSKEK